MDHTLREIVNRCAVVYLGLGSVPNSVVAHNRYGYRSASERPWEGVGFDPCRRRPSPTLRATSRACQVLEKYGAPEESRGGPINYSDAD
jgi:hypothetical protein